MKTVVYEKYGAPDVLKIKTLNKPRPDNHEILIKIKATTVTIGDIRMRKFKVPFFMWLPSRIYLGLFKPKRKVLGMEIAGVIEEIGSEVTKFKLGDEVMASTSGAGFGGYAEYKCLHESGLTAVKPKEVSYGEAAASVGGGLTAVRCLKKANIKEGQQVLIYGASGAVGSCAVQIAKNEYHGVVTAVCSGKNQEMAKALGADYTVDYQKEDFTQSGKKYDVVFDAVAKFPKAKAKRALKPCGVYLNVHKDTHDGPLRKDELEFLVKLLEDNKMRPFIDRAYTLDEVIEAHRYVEQGHKRGNVVITVTDL